jgi:hypothetical protein
MTEMKHELQSHVYISKHLAYAKYLLWRAQSSPDWRNTVAKSRVGSAALDLTITIPSKQGKPEDEIHEDEILVRRNRDVWIMMENTPIVPRPTAWGIFEP